MYGLFRRVGKASVAEYLETGDVQKAFLGMEEKVGSALRSHYSEIIETFGNRVFENRKMERFGQLLFQLYAREGAEKVVGISYQTREQIKRAIKIGERDGIGVRKTAKLITEKTSGAIARSRATTIARTETHAAASFATHAATKELGLPLQRKRWVSVSDSRTRSAHAAVNGQEVGIDEKFVVPFKGSRIEMDYPHDGNGGAGNNINCRCLAIYFTDEDSIYDDVPTPMTTPKPISKPKIDFSGLIERTTLIGDYDEKAISNIINDLMSPLTATVARKVVKPSVIRETQDRGSYSVGGSVIHMNMRDKGQTAIHEYGHCIDNHIGKDGHSGEDLESFWSVKGLKDGVKADGIAMGLGKGMRNKDEVYEKQVKLLFDTTTKTRLFAGERMEYTANVPKFQGASNLSDIIDSYAKGVFLNEYDAIGHGPSYWRNKGFQELEIFANLFAVQNIPRAMKWVNKYMPETQKAFLERMKEIADDVR